MNDAKKFIDELNKKMKGSGYLYRLPTEVEWEYTCRGRSISEDESKFDFYFDKPTNDLSSDDANFDGNYPVGNAAKSKDHEKTAKVGSYKPNKLGLYDMHVNVWEWTDTLEGSVRVGRGGGWGRHRLRLLGGAPERDRTGNLELPPGLPTCRQSVSVGKQVAEPGGEADGVEVMRMALLRPMID